MKSLKNLQPANWNIPLNKRLYEAEINRKNPTAILIMIDQSASMDWNTQTYRGEEKTYSQIVADMVNELLNELIGRCTKSEGVRDYFHTCVLEYGGIDDSNAYSLWDGNLKGKDWVSISELKQNARYEKKTVIKTIRGKSKVSEIEMPYWFKPVANYGTPMGAAFTKAYELLKNWILNGHTASYPPVVINITDGQQTDCIDKELVEITKKIQALNTEDGQILVLNCHISTENKSVIFPLSKDELADNFYAELLYEMSSVMPPVYNSDIAKIRNDTDTFSSYRGMAFNANMDTLFNLIDIGTSGATKQLSNNR